MQEVGEEGDYTSRYTVTTSHVLIKMQEVGEEGDYTSHYTVTTLSQSCIN